MKYVKGFKERALAMLLAATLVASSFSGMSLTAYAGNGNVTVETVTETATETQTDATTESAADDVGETDEAVLGESETSTEEEMSSEETVSSEVVEASSEEITEDAIIADMMSVMSVFEEPGYSVKASVSYNGTVGDEDGRSCLTINEWDYLDAAYAAGEENPEFTDEVIATILEARKVAAQKFDIVDISYSGGNSVSSNVWNGVVDVLAITEDGQATARYNFSGGNVADNNWFFSNPKTTDANVNLAVTMTPGAANAGVTVNFAQTDYPAEYAGINFYTDTHKNDEDVLEKRSDYDVILAAFGGDDTEIVVCEPDGTEIEYVGGWFNTIDMDEEGAWINFNVGDITSLTKDTTYSVVKKVYKGEVDEQEDGREILRIRYHEAGKEFFTADDIVEILQFHDGKTYDEIYIEQPLSMESHVIHKAVVEEAVKYLKSSEDCENPAISYSFCTEGRSVNWMLSKPEAEQIADQTVSIEVGLDGEVPTVSVGSFSFNADDVNVWFGASPENVLSEKMQGYFGEGSCDLKIGDGSTTAWAWYNVDEWNTSINFFGLENLTANEVYDLSVAEYEGRVEDWDDGKHVLFVDFGEAHWDSAFTEEEMLAVLDMHAEDSFDEIGIIQPDTKDVIYKSVADKAAALLKNEEDRVYEDVILDFQFRNQDTGFAKHWKLVNPEAEQEENQTVSMNNTVSENGMEFSVGAQNLKAKSIDVSIERPVENFSDEIEHIKTDILSYEGEGCDVILADTDVEGSFRVDDWNAWLDIWGVERLTPGTVYAVEKKPYRGVTWDDGAKGLVINYLMAGRDTSFTEEELLDILAYYDDEAGSFDAVTIVQTSEPKTIYKSVVDKATTLLKQSEEGSQGQICWAFDGETDAVEWILKNPAAEQESDCTVSANTIISISDNSVSVNIGEHGLAAEQVGVDFVNADSMEMHLMKQILGMENGGLVRLAGTEVIGEMIVDAKIILIFEDIDGLTPDQNYVVEAYDYNGTVFEDENGRHLVVDCFDMEKGGSEYSEQAMIDILNSYEDTDVFTTVAVTVPVEGENTSNVINKDIYNAAIKHLAEDNMGFSYNFDNGERVNCWEFAGAQELSANVTMKYDLVVADNSNVVTAKFTLPTATALKNAQVNLGITFLMGEEFTDSLIWKLGDGSENREYILFPIDKKTTAVQWQNVMGRAMRMYIPGVSLQTKDKVYTIAQRKPGYVSEDEWGTHLWLTSFELGKDSFAEGELAQYLDAYLTDGDKFDSVEVEQKYTTTNKLRKDDINVLRQLLKEEEEAEKRLTYIFCRCEEKTVSENSIQNLQNDFFYTLMNPGEATKDINANVTLTTPANQGIKVKTKANIINAADAYVQYLVNPETALAESLVASLGEATPEGAGLIGLKKGATFNSSDTGYYEYNEGGNFINVHLQVGNLAGDTEYVYSVGEYIGSVSQNGIPSEFQALLDAGATNCVWKSYTTNIATIASTGAVTPINAGWAVFSVSYKIGEQKYFKVFEADVSIALTSISFNDTALTMELSEDNGEWANRAHIDVKYKPANASVDRDPGYLTWTTSDDSVVALVARMEDGKFDGEIKALKAGTATIKAVYPDDETIYAECVVTVEAPFTVPDEAWGEVYAVTNFDKTLADVELPVDEDGQWKWDWKNPNTKLASFANMDYHNFLATFTAADGRKRDMLVRVDMVTISGVDIVPIKLQEGEYGSEWVEAGMPNFLENGESIVFNFMPQVKNGDIEHVVEYFGERIKINWTSAPKNIGTTEVDDYLSGSYKFTADATKAGKKTFTVSLVDSENKNKVIVKDSVSLTVVKNPLINYDLMPENLDELAAARPGDTGTLRFEVPKAGYYKLTVKSSDKAVVKLGTATTETDEATQKVTTLVPYEVKKAGVTQITVTAKDELKSKMVYDVTIVDSEPIVDTSLVTLNTKADIAEMCTAWYYVETPLGFSIESCEFGGEDIELFDANYDTEYGAITFAIKDVTMDKGTYKVSAILTSTNGVITDTHTKDFKIKVINTAPQAKVKQTKNVNTFYTSTPYAEEHFGQLIIDTGKNGLADAFILNAEEEDFIMQRRGSNLFYLQLKPDAGEIDKDVTIQYKISNGSGEYTQTKDITIKTEDKAPAIVINPGTATLYPKLLGSRITGNVTYKKGNGNINLTSIAWVAGENDVRDITGEGMVAELKKNNFRVYRYGGACFGVGVLTAKAGTDKLTLRVQDATWTRPLDVSMKLKVDTKEAKLALSKATITLNKNDAFYNVQSDITELLYKGTTESCWPDNITFTGANAKSAAILNKDLVLEYRDDMYHRGIVARLNTTATTNKDLKTGTYKYNVWVERNNPDGSTYKASTTLTIKIVNVPPAKAVKVTKKGKVDVLLRSYGDPCMTYIPRLSNMPGEVVDGYLTGPDADMFEAYCNGDQLEVYPKYGESYSTKNTYKVQPVFVVSNFEGGRCDVPAAMQSVKVTQGKPVVTFLTNEGNTLYRQAGNELQLGIEARLQFSSVDIEDVYLMNYTDDLTCNYTGYSVVISQHSMNQITTTGKTWTLKFGVKYRDQAGNVKDTVVSHKVVIK